MQSILYICLGHKWGTSEKLAIKHCLMGKSQNFEPILVCVKDSDLDLRAKALGIERIYFTAGRKTSLFRYNFIVYKEISKLIKNKNVALVECFSLEVLWSICSILKNYKLVPLFYIRTTDFKHSYRNFFHQFFFSRIDLVLVTNESLVENCFSGFPIKRKNIEVIGIGIDGSIDSSRTEIRKDLFKRFNFSENAIILGTYFENHCVSAEAFKTLAKAISYFLLSEREQINEIQILCFCEKNWNEHIIKDELGQIIKNYNLEKIVKTFQIDELEEGALLIDLFVGIPTEEYVSEIALLSLKYESQVILPRMAGNANIIETHNGVETYMPYDSRDLRAKIKLLLETRKHVSTEEVKKLLERQSLEYQKKIIFKLYDKSLRKRFRLFQLNKRH